MEQIKFNPQQLEAIQAIVNFILTPFKGQGSEDWCLIINGFAGTGKTTLVQEAIKRVYKLKPHYNICVSAPTHSAVSVLSSFGLDAGIYVESKTIHSLTGLILGENGETRRCFRGSDGSLGNYDVVVLDEGSMAGELIVDTIEQIATTNHVKVIVMGDHGQLNPVKESKSKFFDTNLFPLVKYLTIDERSDKDSPIPSTVTKLREFAYIGKAPSKLVEKLNDNGDGVHIITGKDFITTMLAEFSTDEYKTNSKHCRVLAYTNKEVDKLNTLIRKQLYGKDCDRFVVGETIIIKTPLVKDGELLIATNTECVIKSIGYAKLYDRSDIGKDGSYSEYNVYALTVSVDGKTHRVPVLHESSLKTYSKRCEYLANRAHNKTGTWKQFWDFKGLFTEVKYSHAMTVHLSQGQTFKTVFVRGTNLRKCLKLQERASLWYVSTSRATTNLVIDIYNVG